MPQSENVLNGYFKLNRIYLQFLNVYAIKHMRIFLSISFLYTDTTVLQ